MVSSVTSFSFLFIQLFFLFIRLRTLAWVSAWSARPLGRKTCVPDDVERVANGRTETESAGSYMAGGSRSGHRMECLGERFIGVVGHPGGKGERQKATTNALGGTYWRTQNLSRGDAWTQIAPLILDRIPGFNYVFIVRRWWNRRSNFRIAMWGVRGLTWSLPTFLIWTFLWINDASEEGNNAQTLSLPPARFKKKPLFTVRPKCQHVSNDTVFF